VHGVLDDPDRNLRAIAVTRRLELREVGAVGQALDRLEREARRGRHKICAPMASTSRTHLRNCLHPPGHGLRHTVTVIPDLTVTVTKVVFAPTDPGVTLSDWIRWIGVGVALV
jgi:hypothetical protein